MLPFVLLAGLVVVAAYAKRSAATPDGFRQGATADAIWEEFTKMQGSGTPSYSATDPVVPYGEARASLPSALQAEFDAAMGAADGAKAQVLFDKLGNDYPEASRHLLRKIAKG